MTAFSLIPPVEPSELSEPRSRSGEKALFKASMLAPLRTLQKRRFSASILAFGHYGRFERGGKKE